MDIILKTKKLKENLIEKLKKNFHLNQFNKLNKKIYVLIYNNIN